MSMTKRMIERQRRQRQLTDMDVVRAQFVLKYGKEWVKEFWKAYPKAYIQNSEK